MVESAPLLREWTVLSRPEGSNPSHSAILPSRLPPIARQLVATGTLLYLQFHLLQFQG